MADISSNSSVPRVTPSRQEFHYIHSDALGNGRQLAASIAKLDQAVTNAYNHIHKLFVTYEQNIDGILKRLANDDFSTRSKQAGVTDSQQQIDLQKNYTKLLADQNTAFADFNIALKQIVSKLTPMTVSQTAQVDNNTAKAMGVTYEELMFNRYLSSKSGVDADRADNFQEKVKAILDIKNDQAALLKNLMIKGLYQQNQDILKQISGAQDTKALIPILLQALSKANAAGKKETISAAQDYFGKDANLLAYMINNLIQVLEGKRREDFKSEDFRYQREHDPVWLAEQHAQEANRSLPANLSFAGSQIEYGTNVNVTAQGGAARSSVIQGGALNEASTKMLRNPDEAAAIYGGVDDINKTLGIVNKSIGGIASIFDGLGGSAGEASEGMGTFTKYLGLASVGLKATMSLGVAQVDAMNYALKPAAERPPEYTSQEQKEKLLLAQQEKEKKENQVTLDYLKNKNGWNVDYNTDMYRFDIRDKQGKVMGNTGETLQELTKRVNELRAPGNQEKIRELENWSGYKVDIDPKTLEIGLFNAKGKMIADIGTKLKGEIPWSVERAVKAQWQEDHSRIVQGKKKESTADEVYRSKQQINGDQQKKSEQAKKQAIPVPDNAKPAFPGVDPKILADQFIMAALLDTQIKVDKKLVSVKHNQELQKTKRPTAHDIQMAKEATHIENSNNSYKYDVKITVNPPSGDPVQIARQVCEQLKHHTCGNEMGYSKGAANSQKAQH
ncbi:unnamed protein product [Commensalibacter communis]|uniref:hypothetical protein n=1 Tax=Commensalibacter communis TaxID=2972786 RepID=UPI0022FF58D5|nr:hypothetical protein [Commensalibacter communis]CAI3955114.1 unnamed protein product [Commensalibacter communis]CAI3955870.1 unnamed protein product [Commensalibacter communis]